MSFRVYKRGKKYWYYFCINNTVYRNSTHTDLKDLALQYAQKVYNDIYLDTCGVKNLDILLSDFIEYHLKHKEKNLSERWSQQKRTMLYDFLEFTKSKNIEYLSDVTLAIINEYKTLLLGECNPKTVKNKLNTINTLLYDAVKLEYIKHNPCRNVDPIRGILKNKERYLTKEEIEIIKVATKGTRLEGLVLTALYTGMRRGELCNLEYTDIDLKQRLIYIRNKSKRNFKTKSRKERVVPLHSELIPLFSNISKNSACFQVPVHSATKIFRQLADSVGLSDVGLHTLRHTFVSHCLMNGMNIFDVSRIVGHSTSHITELYGHLCPERREIDKLSF
ncbi:MAG: tyrosine-type recombinase/integrase [Candidatus Jettenia caeni]|nr:MAG: tyrosine-type recombinase/integrase [Candidatus Jettenia caeni]